MRGAELWIEVISQPSRDECTITTFSCRSSPEVGPRTSEADDRRGGTHRTAIGSACAVKCFVMSCEHHTPVVQITLAEREVVAAAPLAVAVVDSPLLSPIPKASCEGTGSTFQCRYPTPGLVAGTGRETGTVRGRGDPVAPSDSRWIRRPGR